MYRYSRILLILSSITIVSGQTAEELKSLMDSYNKIKINQQANEIAEGVEAEKGKDVGPVRLLVKPSDMTKYYRVKMKSLQDDLTKLNELLLYTDSIPPLKHFGYNFFSMRDSVPFIDNANVSSNYILGYGDEIIISVWGQAEQHEIKTLGRDGTIFIENVGLLYLGGKTQSQAKSYLNQRFSKVYSTLNSNPSLTFLELSIGKVKNINVFVSGHAQFPGNYVVNPSISVSNLLILAGGINQTGSLRNIYVQRNGSVIDTLDLYPILSGVGIVEQTSFLEGDILIVPPRGQIVAITGNVLYPAYYEIKPEETVSDILSFSGMVNENIIQQTILSRPKSKNLYLSKSDFKKTLLTHRDSLIVPLFNYPLKSIGVSVANRSETNIPWVEYISFEQILDIVNVNLDNIKRVDLTRNNIEKDEQDFLSFDLSTSNNFKFHSGDYLNIHLHEKFVPARTVVVMGEISSPGTYPLIKPQESLNSVLSRAGGLNQTTNINNVIIKRDTLEFGSSMGHLILSDGDTVDVRPLLGTVKVEGEVHNPGNFEWIENSKAKTYLSLAGGLTSYGDKKHIVYISPYGEAMKIKKQSNQTVLPGSIIRVSQLPLAQQKIRPDRFQQISSIVTSLVSIAILANTTN